MIHVNQIIDTTHTHTNIGQPVRAVDARHSKTHTRHTHTHLGENRPLLVSPRAPKGPEDEYMLSRKKSWTTGEDTVRLCEGLLVPCTKLLAQREQHRIG